jgi:hypothetical protein
VNNLAGYSKIPFLGFFWWSVLELSFWRSLTAEIIDFISLKSREIGFEPKMIY